ncbi:MAG: VOC family protein [Gammaproteobacteria bacterium]
MRLRQIALVARELDPVVDDLCAVLGLSVCFNDPGVGHFGLHNALLPVHGNLLEVVAPTRPGTTAGRYLDRRGGDGGYMLLFQVDDAAAWRAHMAEHGVRVVWETATAEVVANHFHPQDTPGAIVSIDTMLPLSDWHDEQADWLWAGPDWRSHVRTDCTQAFTAVELQGPDPKALAERWSALFQRPLTTDAAGRPQIGFDNMALRFVPDHDGRGLGIGAIDVLPQDRARMLRAAEARGRRTGPNEVTLGGVRFNLI